MDGTIPDAAIERAREMSGFYRAEFVEKDFADEDDIEKVYGSSAVADEDDNGTWTGVHRGGISEASSCADGTPAA